MQQMLVHVGHVGTFITYQLVRRFLISYVMRTAAF